MTQARGPARGGSADSAPPEPLDRELEEVDAKYQALLDVTRGTILELDAVGVLHDFHVNPELGAAEALAALRHQNVCDRVDGPVPQRLVDEGMGRVRRVLSTGIPETYEVHIGENGATRRFGIRIARAGASRALVSIVESTESYSRQLAMTRMLCQAQSHLATSVDKCVCRELAHVAELAKELTRELPEATKTATQLASRIEQALTKARRMVSSLCPTRLETDGLGSCLRDLAEHVRQNCHVECVVEESGVCPRNYTWSLQLFRVAREALENIVCHSKPKCVRVSLETHDGLTTLQVTGDDCGEFLNCAETAEISRQAMQLHAAVIGASLEVGIHSGVADSVRCSVATSTP